MAKDKGKAKDTKVEGTEKKPKRKMPFLNPFFVLVLVLGLSFMASAIVILVSMLPTVIAYMLDRGRPRTLGITVGAMNIAGTTGVWLDLVRQGHELSEAVDIALDPSNVAMSYGLALVGLAIYLNVSPFVAKMNARKASFEIKRILKRQDALKENWGAGVAEPLVVGK